MSPPFLEAGEMEKQFIRKEKILNDGWFFSFKGREDEDFCSVNLPHDWAICSNFDKTMKEGASQGFRNRLSVGWYRRTIFLPEKNEKNSYLLEFGGIYEDSTVWINGIMAGGRKFGYSSFTLDVTKLLKKGENLIEIKADCSGYPLDRWYSGAGIYRTVKFMEVEKIHFDMSEIFVKSRIEGDKAFVTVEHGLKDRNVTGLLYYDEKLIASGENTEGIWKFEVEHPNLWSAETPDLYELVLSLKDGQRIADQIRMRIGLREIHMLPQKGMFVNGKKIRLKGVCLHQDVGCMGVAAKKEIYRQRLLALKEAGCNAIRAAHHIYSTEFLDLCDELGFYVYEECFDKWHGGHYGLFFDSEWKKDVETMIKRDRNHACIFIWGIGNEVENQAQRSMLKTLKMLAEYVKQMDSTRPLTYAMNPHFKYESDVDILQVKDIQKYVDEVSDTEIYDNAERVECIAKIAEYVDVISCNYQEQWYNLIHERIPEKLILGTEVYQYFMGNPEQLQNFTERNPSLFSEQLDYVIGSFIWTGIDYLGESMGYPSKGWSGSLIQTNGKRKPGYYIMQSYWSHEPMVRFMVMDYSMTDEAVKEHWDIPMLAEHWHFPQFHRAVIPYMIASNCEEIQLYLNGKQFMISKPSECKNRLVTGFLPYQPGEVRVIGYKEGKEVCSHTVVTPEIAVKLKFAGEAWTFQTPKILPAEKGYQLQLSVKAYDKQDHPCCRESARVSFRIEGPAEILAVDAGDLMSHEVYQNNRIHMYRGQASVMIGLTGEAGRVCVYAYAEGMQEACQTLIVQ